jgi:hypothetical protein
LSDAYLAESQKYQGEAMSDTFAKEKNKLQDKMIISQAYQDYLSTLARINAIERGDLAADDKARAEEQARLTAAFGKLTELTVTFASKWGSPDSKTDTAGKGTGTEKVSSSINSDDAGWV